MTRKPPAIESVLAGVVALVVLTVGSAAVAGLMVRVFVAVAGVG